MILGFEAWVFWLALAIILLLVESTTISLVPVWFAAGSLVAMALDWFGVSPGIQLAAMLAVSAALLSISMFVIRPRLHQSGESAIPSTEFLGQEGIVVDRIDPSAGVGLIFLCGQTWSAGSESGDIIEKDTPVQVILIRGQKAIVRPLEAGPPESELSGPEPSGPGPSESDPSGAVASGAESSGAVASGADPSGKGQPTVADGVPEPREAPERPAGARKDLSAETRPHSTASG